MLALTRKTLEKVQITDTQTGEIITVVLLRVISCGKVSLGFEASERFRIMRKELVKDGT